MAGKQRRRFSSEEKIRMPTLFYRWQEDFFENGALKKVLGRFDMDVDRTRHACQTCVPDMRARHACQTCVIVWLTM